MYEQIVEAFEDIRFFYFGSRRRRLHETDEDTAKEWASTGLPLSLICAILGDRMSYMHEKSLSWGKEKDNTPWSLHLFTDNILRAAMRFNGAGEEMPQWAQSESQWRARLSSFKKNPELWNADQWGEPPGSDYCRVEPRLLSEYGLIASAKESA